MYKELCTRKSGLIKPWSRASCSNLVVFRMSCAIKYYLVLYMIENLIKISETVIEKTDFPFRPLESVLLFPWWYNLCSFMWGSDLHKQLKSNNNCYSSFWGNGNFRLGARSLAAKMFVFTKHRNMTYKLLNGATR